MKPIQKIILSYIFIASILQAQQYPNNNELFGGKNILILGGTGYLGRAITTEVLKYNPRQVTVLSRDEVKHFNVTRMFAQDSRLRTMIGDIRDYDCLLHATKNMDIVFHVAALKRMDMIESNVEEAIKTNVISSIHVFNACVANNVDKVLFISTDKACLPINAYGACKFVSEKIFTNYDRTKIKTKCMVTRFGNILESTGSVIPIFRDKIKNGENIPLTDARMTRFIISGKDAAELICDALRYGVGGEIFIRKLPSMLIADLIEVLKTRFNTNNSVRMIGLRPGEKIHEMLMNESEMARAYEFNGYFIIRPSIASMHDDTGSELPVYMKQGTAISHSCAYDYSSDQAVLSQDALTQLLNAVGM